MGERSSTLHDWIDEITDEQCMEIFWLYVANPDEFLAAHPPALLGAAMRFALRTVAVRTAENDN